MRLSTVLPHLSILARPIVPLAALAFALGGCSSLRGAPAATGYAPSSSRASSFAASSPRPSVLYLTNGVPHSVRKDYIERYACASGIPLACTCTSRLAEECDCRC